MKKYSYLRYAFTMTTLFFTAHLHAKTTVKEACIEEVETVAVESDSLCSSYIKGFLDGALLTDTAIIDNLTNEKSAFFQRAYQTRTSLSRTSIPATYLAKFCLPENKSLSELVTAITESIDMEVLESKSLNTLIYDTIKEIYPCDNK